MSVPVFRRRELDFQLHELLDLHALTAQPRFAQHDADSLNQTLDAALRIAQERFADHAALVDIDEPRMEGGQVVLRPEIKRALDAYIEAGFLSAYFNEEDGGLQLPFLLTTAIGAIFSAANPSTVGYAVLTAAAANLLVAHASPAQRARYVPHMLSGRFFGTMCLTEPQAGSSLADIRTRATPQPDGTFLIQGDKMWISGGEHELSENIVHLVLAKIDGAPAGTAGISLFIVPRYRVGEGGARGESNGVTLIGLNHKLGNRATVNTALAFGADAPCVGELVGEPGRGLAAMFHMMNEARLAIGVVSAGLGMAGYLYAADYARTRTQGRPLGERDPNTAPIPIIRHPDVRRMLLQQRALVEGSLALCLYCARLVDEAACAPDEASQRAAHALLDLLTPVAKAYPSEHCTRANDMAIQVLGGYGYSREYPVERLWRDNRINPIHEGTNGIQGLDLLGRKVLRDQGAALGMLGQRVMATVAAGRADARCVGLSAQLAEALGHVQRATGAAAAQAMGGQMELAMSQSAPYLELVGHAVIGWMWLRQALAASAALDRAGVSDADRSFYEGKLAACRAFYLYELPKCAALAGIVASGDTLLVALDDAVI